MPRSAASSRMATALFSPWAKNSSSPVYLPSSSMRALDEMKPVMPEQLGERLDDLLGRHRDQVDLVVVGQVLVDELDRLVVDERLDDVVDRVGDERPDLVAVPAPGDLEHRLADLAQLVLVGAEAQEHHLADDGPARGSGGAAARARGTPGPAPPGRTSR